MQRDGLRFLIPDPDGPIDIVELDRRPDLPTSLVLTVSDRSVQPWSGDYDGFTAASGPLAAIEGAAGSFVLGLSAVPSAHRLWELPVLADHWATAREARPKTGDAEATRTIVWIAGTLDHHAGADLDDVSLAPPEIRPEVLVEASLPRLRDEDRAKHVVLALLADGDDAEAARARLAEALPDARHRVRIVRRFADICAVLNEPLLPVPAPRRDLTTTSVATAAPGLTSMRLASRLGLAALAALTGGLWLWAAGADHGSVMTISAPGLADKEVPVPSAPPVPARPAPSASPPTTAAANSAEPSVSGEPVTAASPLRTGDGTSPNPPTDDTRRPPHAATATVTGSGTAASLLEPTSPATASPPPAPLLPRADATAPAAPAPSAAQGGEMPALAPTTTEAAAARARSAVAAEVRLPLPRVHPEPRPAKKTSTDTVVAPRAVALKVPRVPEEAVPVSACGIRVFALRARSGGSCLPVFLGEEAPMREALAVSTDGRIERPRRPAPLCGYDIAAPAAAVGFDPLSSHGFSERTAPEAGTRRLLLGSGRGQVLAATPGRWLVVRRAGGADCRLAFE